MGMGAETRRTAARLFAEGVSRAGTARRLGVSRATATRWYQRWEASGSSGLEAPSATGRRPRLAPDQLAAIGRALATPPRAAGYDLARWSLTAVAALIERETGVTYHPRHVARVLRRVGWIVPPVGPLAEHAFRELPQADPDGNRFLLRQRPGGVVTENVTDPRPPSRGGSIMRLCPGRRAAPTRMAPWLWASLLAMISVTCVQVTSQRIAWFHDEGADELRVLLFNDGIHDSGGTLFGSGPEQIARSSEQRSFILPLTPFGIHLATLVEDRADAPDETLDAAWRDIMADIRVEVLGHYREPNGQLGAAQLVTIPRLTAFLDVLNRSIDETVVVGTLDREWRDLPRTAARWRAAARKGHRWVAFEGQELVASLPIDRREWRGLKARWLTRGVRDLLETVLDDRRHDLEMVAAALATLVRAPLSITEGMGAVTVRIGPGESGGWLTVPRDPFYEDDLEEHVLSASPRDLDAALADILLGDAEPEAPLVDVLTWGPPADTLRALVSASRNDDRPRSRRARARLSTWVVQWNADVGLPAAPEPPDILDDAWCEAVHAWYDELIAWPSVEILDGAGLR